MKFVLSVFSTAETIDPATAARAAEDAGFEAILFPDHTHIPVDRRSPYPGDGEMPAFYPRAYDPFIAMSFAAAATSRIRVGVGVALVPERDPIVMAKQVASLDVLSGGRLLLGIGAGWNVEEAENHGTAGKDRWAVMRERVLAMKQIWAADEAQYHGAHVNFDPIWSWPKPLQKPHPPILIGGHGPRVIERVLEYGDAWMPIPTRGTAPVGERIAELQRLAADRGRGHIPVSVQAFGTPPKDSVVEKLIASGVDHVILSLPQVGPDAGLEAIALQAEVLRRYRDV